MLVATLLAALSATCFAWEISSRELVDMQFLADDTLIILVSPPGATDPGIYRWQYGATEPFLMCKISSRAAFSFDRKTIIERVAGQSHELRLYDPSDCRLRARVPVEGRVLDVDVHEDQVAIALGTGGRANELRLYSTSGRVLARTEIGRNVEMGFAPDGHTVVNFDPSDGGAIAWHAPTLVRQPLPAWIFSGESTFVPGSSFVKRYVDGMLSVMTWPAGTTRYSIPSTRSVRLRQLSASGRFGVAHTQSDIVGTLDWIDFDAENRVRLTTGNVDHAAINSAGNLTAWALRHKAKNHRVEVRYARVNANGDVVTPGDTSETRQ